MTRLNIKISHFLLALTCYMTATSTNAQELQLVFHPGDTLRFVITFEREAAIDSAGVYFVLQTPIAQNQNGMQTSFWANQSTRRLSDTEWEVSGKIAEVPSGKYDANRVDASQRGASRTYSVGNGLPKTLTIRVENPEHTNLPDIKDIVLKSGQ